MLHGFVQELRPGDAISKKNIPIDSGKNSKKSSANPCTVYKHIQTTKTIFQYIPVISYQSPTNILTICQLAPGAPPAAHKGVIDITQDLHRRESKKSQLIGGKHSILVGGFNLPL